MSQFWLEFWVVITAVLVGLNASTVGSFLVLQRNAMLADAMSHAVLLGLVLAVLFVGSREPTFLFVGATAVSLLTAYLALAVQRRGLIREDAGIGISFTSLFALGVFLAAIFSREVDIDPDCILYGEIIFIPFDRVEWLGVELGPRAFWSLLLTFVVSLMVILFCYRQLKLTCFDPLFSQSIGVSVEWWKFVLLLLTAVVVVVSFRAVGAILILGLIVLPANTALQLSRTLPGTIFWSWAFALIAVALGYLGAGLADASVSASIVLASALVFAAVLIFRGAIAQRASRS